jgi:hypothetical protein
MHEQPCMQGTGVSACCSAEVLLLSLVSLAAAMSPQAQDYMKNLNALMHAGAGLWVMVTLGPNRGSGPTRVGPT